MDETIGLGFHSHRDAITGVASPTAAVPAASASINQQHATTKFVSSSADSKRMSMLFPPPPPHPSTAVQQPIIQLNDNRHPSLQIQQQLPLSTSSTHVPHHDMHQNINFTNHPPTSSSFQPPPGLPPPLSIPAAITVPPSQLPPPPIPIQQQSSQMEQQQQQQNDSIAKARAIAQRFHTQSNNQPPSYISSIHNQHSNSVINNNNNDNNNVNKNINSYAQKRQQHFQTEQLKLQTYTLKNLDYILKHDETQLRSHVECMNEMTEWGERQGLQLQLIRRQQLEREQKREQQKQQRQQREVEQKSGGGIGSKDQRYLERIKRRRQLDTTSATNPQQQQQQRTSIYLTNLPTDGSITERTLRSLFCVYGHLDRVTMYRNRSTGELKGDGLIVFGVDDATINLGGNESGNNVQETTTNGRDLIETVCMQMNGAELPCGTVIGVEPADMDWGRRGKDEKFKQMDHCVQQLQQQGTASSGEGDVVMQSKEASMKGEDDDEEEEDLDDFFASLE